MLPYVGRIAADVERVFSRLRREGVSLRRLKARLRRGGMDIEASHAVRAYRARIEILSARIEAFHAELAKVGASVVNHEDGTISWPTTNGNGYVGVLMWSPSLGSTHALWQPCDEAEAVQIRLPVRAACGGWAHPGAVEGLVRLMLQ